MKLIQLKVTSFIKKNTEVFLLIFLIVISTLFIQIYNSQNKKKDPTLKSGSQPRSDQWLLPKFSPNLPKPSQTLPKPFLNPPEPLSKPFPTLPKTLPKRSKIDEKLKLQKKRQHLLT